MIALGPLVIELFVFVFVLLSDCDWERIMFSMQGKEYANVLPEPVRARINMSFFCRAIGMVLVWTVVGFINPADNKAFTKR